MGIEPVFEGDLVVGRFYMVPTVKAVFNGRLDDWPVIGPAHEDAEIIGFPHIHYHFDFRFFSIGQLEALGGGEVRHNYVLYRYSDNPELGPVIYRRRKCRRPMPEFPREVVFRKPGKKNWLRKLEAAYRDATLKPGLICPHRGASLRGLPVTDNCVVCPLHGLRWNVKTGKLVPEGSNTL